MLQGWFLYYQAKFWRGPAGPRLLGAVPDDHMIVLDLWGDRYPVWQEREAFYGKPWVWNVLYNFGGKVSLNGDLPRIAANLDSVLQSPDQGRLTGLGMTMEGLGTNPIVPDFVMDQTWRDSVPPLDEWTRDYVARRYGAPTRMRGTPGSCCSPRRIARRAQTGKFLAERPQFYVKGTAYRSEPVPPYDPRDAGAGARLAAGGGAGARRERRLPLRRRQPHAPGAGQLGVPLVNQVQDAYTRKDLHGTPLRRRIACSGCSRDLDELVGTRREFLLGRWLADAKRWGTTDAERRLYEWNARNIITLWGTKCTEGQNDDLNLYAYKEWQGMFIVVFPAALAGVLRPARSIRRDGRRPSTVRRSRRRCARGSSAWSSETGTFPTAPRGDAVATARRLASNYHDLQY